MSDTVVTPETDTNPPVGAPVAPAAPAVLRNVVPDEAPRLPSSTLAPAAPFAPAVTDAPALPLTSPVLNASSLATVEGPPCDAVTMPTLPSLPAAAPAAPRAATAPMPSSNAADAFDVTRIATDRFAANELPCDADGQPTLPVAVSATTAGEQAMAHLMPPRSSPSEASQRAAAARAQKKAKARRVKIIVMIGALVFAVLVGPPLLSWLGNAINESGNTSTVDE